MSNWYRWPSLAEFTKWHEAVKAELGIPRPGRGLSSGRERPANQWTLAYTDAYVVAEDDVRAIAEDDVMHIPGLGEPCDNPLACVRLEDSEPIADKKMDAKGNTAWVMRPEAVERLRTIERKSE